MAEVTFAGGRQRELTRCNNLVLSVSFSGLFGGHLVNAADGEHVLTTLGSDAVAEMGAETRVCAVRGGIYEGGEKRERLTGQFNPSFFSFLVDMQTCGEGMSRVARFYTGYIR